MRALILVFGGAGAFLAVGLFITDAPGWACVLAAGAWLSVVVLAWMSVRMFSLVLRDPQVTLESDEPAPQFDMPAGALRRGSDAPVAESDSSREAEQAALHYALSHDLRAPLRVIDGFTRIVKEDYSRHLDRLGQDHLERVLAASARMNGMIDAILAQAKLGAESLNRNEIDISRVVQDVAAELAGTLAAPASVEWVIQPGLWVMADAGLLRRVIENLVGNALKYSAKVPSPRVEFGCMSATNPPVFFVRDNGAGFDMQHAEKLFGMFQRLHSAKDFEGTGVGLASVRHIIRRHGGRVWAEAQPGRGACFYFTLADRLDGDF